MGSNAAVGTLPIAPPTQPWTALCNRFSSCEEKSVKLLSPMIFSTVAASGRSDGSPGSREVFGGTPRGRAKPWASGWDASAPVR
jgi:hypothetical protein